MLASLPTHHICRAFPPHVFPTLHTVSSYHEYLREPEPLPLESNHFELEIINLARCALPTTDPFPHSLPFKPATDRPLAPALFAFQTVVASRHLSTPRPRLQAGPTYQSFLNGSRALCHVSQLHSDISSPLRRILALSRVFQAHPELIDYYQNQQLSFLSVCRSTDFSDPLTILELYCLYECGRAPSRALTNLWLTSYCTLNEAIFYHNLVLDIHINPKFGICHVDHSFMVVFRILSCFTPSQVRKVEDRYNFLKIFPAGMLEALNPDTVILHQFAPIATRTPFLHSSTFLASPEFFLEFVPDAFHTGIGRMCDCTTPAMPIETCVLCFYNWQLLYTNEGSPANFPVALAGAADDPLRASHETSVGGQPIFAILSYILEQLMDLPTVDEDDGVRQRAITIEKCYTLTESFTRILDWVFSFFHAPTNVVDAWMKHVGQINRMFESFGLAHQMNSVPGIPETPVVPTPYALEFTDPLPAANIPFVQQHVKCFISTSQFSTQMGEITKALSRVSPFWCHRWCGFVVASQNFMRLSPVLMFCSFLREYAPAMDHHDARSLSAAVFNKVWSLPGLRLWEKTLLTQFWDFQHRRFSLGVTPGLLALGSVDVPHILPAGSVEAFNNFRNSLSPPNSVHTNAGFFASSSLNAEQLTERIMEWRDEVDRQYGIVPNVPFDHTNDTDESDTMYENIERTLTNTFQALGIGTSHAIIAVSQVASLVCSIYNLVVECSRQERSVALIVSNATILASSIVSLGVVLYGTVKQTAKAWIHGRLIDSLRESLLGTQPQWDNTRSPLTLIKITSVVAVGITRACGFKAPTDIMNGIGNNFKAIDATNEALTDFLVDVFQVDVDGRLAEAAIIKGAEAAGEKYLALPAVNWTGPLFTEVREFLTLANDLLRRPRSKHSPQVTRLGGIVADVSRKLSEVSKMLTTNRRRPVPMAIWIYGDPGLGKSELVQQHLIPHLAKRFNVSPAIYNLDSGKYSLPVAAQPWAVYDEAGAKNLTNNSDDILTRLNSLISPAPCQLPGAALEDKNQVAWFNGIFFISNVDPAMVSFGTNAEAARASLTRLDVYKVVDNQYNPQFGRNGQLHRQPDFSHLRFEPKGDSLRRHFMMQAAMDTISVEQLILRAEQQLIVNTNRYHEERMAPLVPQHPVIANGLTLPSALDIPQTGTKFHVCLSGPSGSRKTTVLLPQIISVFSRIGFDIERYSKESRPPTTSRICWVVDDVFDFTDACACQEFLSWNATLSSEDVVVVVTNVGPAFSKLLSYILWKDYQWIKCNVLTVPGLQRRLGWDQKRPEALTLYTTADTVCREYWGGTAFSEALLLRAYQNHVTGMDFLKVHLGIPPVPFSANEADAWWVTTEPVPLNPSKVFLLRNIKLSTRAAKYFWTHASGIMDDPNWFTTMQRVLTTTLCQTIPDAKVYISVPGSSFLVYNGTFYVGERAQAPVLTSGVADFRAVWTDKGDTQSFVIKREQLVAFLTTGLAASQDLEDIMAWTALSNAFTNQTPEWNALTSSSTYTLTVTECVLAQNHLASRRKTSGFQFMKENWKLALAISTLTVGLGYIAFSIFRHFTRTKKVVLPNAPPLSETCEFCSRKQYCPNKDWTEEETQAKGKTKGGRGRLKGMGPGGRRKFMWQGVVYYEDDFEGDQFFERLLHDFNRRLKDNDFTFNGSHYLVNIPTADGLIVGKLQTTGGDWSFDYAAATADVPQSQGVEERVLHNTVKVYNKAGDAFTAVVLNSSLLVTSAHCVSDEADVISFVDPKFLNLQVTVLSLDRVREICFLFTVTPDGTRFSLPKFHNLLPLLVNRQNIPVSGMTTLVGERANGRTFSFTSPYTIQRIPTPVFNAAILSCWGLDAGFMSWGTATCPSIAGDSGSPVLLHTKEGYALVGVHAGSRVCSRQLFFAVLSIESVQEALTATDKPHLSYSAEETVYFPPPSLEVQRITEINKPDLVVSLPATNVGRVRNSLPMDTKDSKHPISFGPLEDVFGNLKEPALSVKTTEEKYQSMIPPDACGNYRAPNIKLTHIQTYKHVDPAMLSRTIACAIKLAQYYQMHYGLTEPLQVLSVNQALNGFSPDTRLVTDSSTGAAFQLLHPEAPTKAHLMMLREDGSLTIAKSAAGDTLGSLIEQQWEAAKHQQFVALPASTSFKSELLPHEKAWRKRIINIVDPATVINQKRFLLPLMRVLTSDGEQSDFQLKTNPYADWNVIGQRLQLQNTGGIASLDFSNFDWTVPEELFIAAAHFIAVFYDSGSNHLLLKRIMTLVHGISLQHIIVGKDLISKQHGMLSGIYGTSLLDSIIVKIMLYASYSTALEPCDPTPAPVEDFFSNVTSVGCGDDTTLSIADTVVEKFNPTVITTFVADEFAMVATLPDKNASAHGFVPIEEASFCSRTFVPFPDHPAFWTTKLKAEAMSGICCWSRFTSPDDVATQLEQLRTEFIGWGEEKYRKFECAFRAFCLCKNIPYQPKTWDTLKMEAWEVLKTVPIPNVIKQIQEISVPTLQQKQVLQELIKKTMANFSVVPPVHTVSYDTIGQSSKKKKLSQAVHSVDNFADFKKTTFCKTFAESVPDPPKRTSTFPASRDTYTIPERIWPQSLALLCHHDSPTIEKLYESLYRNTDGTNARYSSDLHFAGLMKHVAASPWDDHFWKALLSYFYDSAQADRGAHATGPSMIEGGPPPPTTTGTITASAGGVMPTNPGLIATPNVVGPAVPANVVNSDVIAPPILATIGGIDGKNVDQIGFFRSFLSYGEPYYIDTHYLSTTTQAWTIVGTWDFDLFDPNLIGPMCYRLAREHRYAVGDLIMKFQIGSQSLAYGMMGIFYIPGIEVPNYTTDPTWLFQFPHVEFDVNSHSDFTVNVTGGNDGTFLMHRDAASGGRYGRVVMMTTTSIQNSFGSNIPVPIRRFGCLGPKSAFSGILPLNSPLIVPSNNDMAIAGTAAVIDGNYQNHVTGGKFAIYPESSAGRFYMPISTSGFQACYINCTGDLPVQANTSSTVYSPPGIPGAAAFGYVGVPAGGTPGSGFSQTVLSGVTSTKATLTVSPADPIGTINMVWTGQVQGNVNSTIFTTAPAVASGGLQCGALTAFIAPVAGTPGINFNVRDTYINFDGALYDNVTIRANITALVVGYGGFPANAENVNFTNWAKTGIAYPGSVAFNGTYTATQGYTHPRESTIPANYVSVDFLGLDMPNPAVAPAVTGHTLVVGGVGTTQKINDLNFFTANPSIGSIITTFTDNSGQGSFVLLRNKFGYFVNAGATGIMYATFKAVPGSMKQTHEVSSNIWPGVVPIIANNWALRQLIPRSSAATYEDRLIARSRSLGISHDLPTPQAMFGAMLAGGALSGIGNAIGKSAEYDQQLKMQNNSQDFQMYLNNSKQDWGTDMQNNRQTWGTNMQTQNQNWGTSQTNLQARLALSNQEALNSQMFGFNSQMQARQLAAQYGVVNSRSAPVMDTATEVKTPVPSMSSIQLPSGNPSASYNSFPAYKGGEAE